MCVQDTEEALENLEPDVESLIQQGEQLLQMTQAKDPVQAQKLELKINGLKERWLTLERDAEKRKETLQVVVPQWYLFKNQTDEMERWMEGVDEQMKDAMEDEEKMKVG